MEHLLFGSECGDVSALERVAAALLAPVLPRPAPRGAAWSGELCRCPGSGALTGLLPEEDAALLESPNNFWHEYCKALLGQNAPSGR